MRAGRLHAARAGRAPRARLGGRHDGGWAERSPAPSSRRRSCAAGGLELEGAIVGDPDPFAAVGDVLHAREFDDVIVSTPPPGIAGWLRLSLPTRLRSGTELPVGELTVTRRARARRRCVAPPRRRLVRRSVAPAPAAAAVVAPPESPWSRVRVGRGRRPFGSPGSSARFRFRRRRFGAGFRAPVCRLSRPGRCRPPGRSPSAAPARRRRRSIRRRSRSAGWPGLRRRARQRRRSTSPEQGQPDPFDGSRQPHPRDLDDRSQAAALAVGEPHVAAPLAGQLARDRQAEAGPARSALAGAAAAEALEDRLLLAAGEPGAAVEHLEPAGGGGRRSPRAGRRVEQRVLDQGVDRAVQVGAGAPADGPPRRLVPRARSRARPAVALPALDRAPARTAPRSSRSPGSSCSPARLRISSSSTISESRSISRIAASTSVDRGSSPRKRSPSASSRSRSPVSGVRSWWEASATKSCWTRSSRFTRWVISLKVRASERCSVLPSTATLASRSPSATRRGGAVEAPDRAGDLLRRSGRRRSARARGRRRRGRRRRGSRCARRG